MINLFEVYKNRLIEILIKNNSYIYGDTVINIINNKKFNYINAIAPIIFKDIIERDLYKYISKVISTYNNFSYTVSVTNYECEYNKKEYYLSIIYAPIIDKPMDIILKKYIIIDIDLLSLNRNGLSLIYSHNDLKIIPNPILKILNNIKNKKFNICGELIPENISIVFDLVNKGWRNEEETNLIRCNSSYMSDKCSICTETFVHNCWIYKLKCNHIYHKKCWIENIKHQITQSKDKMNCPLCRREYSYRDIIS